MPLTYSTTISAMLLFTVLAAPTQAADIDIKGIRLGMTRDELIAHGAAMNSRHELAMPGFTVGGVANTNTNEADLFIEDDKLYMFSFLFAPSKFDQVLDAVKAKYPQTTCDNSELQNGFGAKFQQTYCSYTDGKTTLQVARMLTKDIGALTLVTNSSLNQTKESREKKKQDI